MRSLKKAATRTGFARGWPQIAIAPKAHASQVEIRSPTSIIAQQPATNLPFEFDGFWPIAAVVVSMLLD